jgi:hypothetical protein
VNQWVYPQAVGVDSFFLAARRGLSEELSQSVDVRDGLDLLTWTLPEETERMKTAIKINWHMHILKALNYALQSTCDG